MQDAQALYEHGVAAVKAQDLASGRQYLRDSIKLDPTNERAWLWLAKTMSSDESKLKCVTGALNINPDNETALEMQRRLLKKLGREFPDPVIETATMKPVYVPPTDRAEVPLGRPVASARIRLTMQIQKALFIWIAGSFSYLVNRDLWKTISAAQKAGEEIEFWEGATFAFFGFLMLAVVYQLYVFITNWGKKIVVYENGMTYRNFLGTYTCRWREVTNIDSKDEVTIHRVRMLGGLLRIPVYKQVDHHIKIYKNGRFFCDITKDFHHFRGLGVLVLRSAKYYSF